MLDPFEGGSLTIRVVAEDGTLLPGAILTIMNLASRLERVTISGAEGVGRFRFIPPGGYALRARLEGFSIATQSNINVDAGQDTRITITLSPM